MEIWKLWRELRHFSGKDLVLQEVVYIKRTLKIKTRLGIYKLFVSFWIIYNTQSLWNSHGKIPDKLVRQVAGGTFNLIFKIGHWEILKPASVFSAEKCDVRNHLWKWKRVRNVVLPLQKIHSLKAVKIIESLFFGKFIFFLRTRWQKPQCIQSCLFQDSKGYYSMGTGKILLEKEKEEIY